MSIQRANILLVEDDEDYVRLIQRAFKDCSDQFELSVASNLKEAKAYLAKNRQDLVVTDMRLPDGQGIELLQSSEESCQFPIVVITGYRDERLAVEAMKAGALDYVFKSHETLVDMPHIVERALREWHHITERRRMEKDLKVRLRYEEALARCSQSLLTDTDVEEPLTGVLRQLLEVSRVSRVYIFENFEDEDRGLCVRQTHEVCSAGVKAEIDNPTLQNYPYKDGFGRWQERLSQGEPISGIIENFPQSERDVLEPQETLSILVLPIWVGGRWYGFIGFDDTQEQRQWSERDIQLLQTTAEIIGAYLEREQSKEKLLEYQEQLHCLLGRLTRAETRGRKRITEILHDDVVQNLIFLKMKFGDLRSFASSPEFTKTLNTVDELTGDLIQRMRALTFDLSFPVLYDLGLAAAIKEWLRREVQEKHGVSTRFNDSGQSKPLDEDLCVLLYRAVRELLTNVVKHARAKNVEVCICRDEDKIAITIEDDGTGFTEAENGPQYSMLGGFGLFTIAESLSQYDGSLKIESKPGEGTRVVLTAPLKDKSEQ